MEEFEVVEDHVADARVGFNVAPTDTAPVVLSRVSRTTPDADPVRQLRLLRWGLVPSWAKDPRGGARMINARAEAVFDRPAFRRPVLTRRCLVPATGWYEWRTEAGSTTSRPRRQPFFMRRRDGATVALAGLYEFWRDPAVADGDDPAAWVVSFSVLTRAAEPGLDEIHHRMPLVLEPGMWGEWLSPQVTDRAQVEAMLVRAQAVPAGRFQNHPVSDAVNNARHDGPELIAPLS